MRHFRKFQNMILKDVVYELQILAPTLDASYDSPIWDYDSMLKEFLMQDLIKTVTKIDETGDAKKDPEKRKLEFDANFITRILKATLHTGHFEPRNTVLKKTVHSFRAREEERTRIHEDRLKIKCEYFENTVKSLNERLRYAKTFCFYLWDVTLMKALAANDMNYFTIKYFRDWHHSQRELQDIKSEWKIKKEIKTIKKYKDLKRKEESVGMTLREFNIERMEEVKKEACEVEEQLMEEQANIEKKIQAIKYEIKTMRETTKDLNELMELRQKQIDEYLEYKAEKQQREYEKFLEYENELRDTQARKYLESVASTPKSQKPKKRKSKRRKA